MSHNPFLDLGFPERRPSYYASVASSPQPTISKPVNGNIDRLSIKFSIKLIVRAGLPVGVTAERGSSGGSTSRRCTGHPSAAAM
jgi:hypothetical protein